MNLLSKFLNITDFSDYDDFRRNAKLCVPSDFNFGFDVVDEYARLCPEKRALVWCNQKGEEKVITFGEMKELSLKMCNVISSYGVKKGDFVMSILGTCRGVLQNGRRTYPRNAHAHPERRRVPRERGGREAAVCDGRRRCGTYLACPSRLQKPERRVIGKRRALRQP